MDLYRSTRTVDRKRWYKHVLCIYLLNEKDCKFFEQFRTASSLYPFMNLPAKKDVKKTKSKQKNGVQARCHNYRLKVSTATIACL